MADDIGAARKKLVEAGRYWIERSRDANAGKDTVAEDLEAIGAHDAAQEYRDQQPADAFIVESGNWRAIEAFLAVQSQFRDGGFRYEGVKAGLDMANIECTAELFTQLRLIESGALKALNEHKK